MSTVPDHDVQGGVRREIADKYPDILTVHPTILHVVRKAEGKQRLLHREPVPNVQHGRQEFLLVGNILKIRNQTGPEDLNRPEPIADEDEMFEVGDDRLIRLGKSAGWLNLIIMIPKSKARSSDMDISLKKVLALRVMDPEAVSALANEFTRRNSHRLKRMRLKVEIFCLATGRSLCSRISSPISDSASKTHGAMDLYDVTPLRSCASGGRKVVMIAEFGLARNVVPIFQLYSAQGERLTEEEKRIA